MEPHTTLQRQPEIETAFAKLTWNAAMKTADEFMEAVEDCDYGLQDKYTI